jgi:hypothetical protein
VVALVVDIGALAVGLEDIRLPLDSVYFLELITRQQLELAVLVHWVHLELLAIIQYLVQ